MTRGLAVAIFVLSAVPAHASEWHVSASGTDPSAGCQTGAAMTPFRTIQKAIDCAQPGDTVTVHPGTYSGQIQTVRGGTSDSDRITIKSAVRRQAIIVPRPREATKRIVHIRHPYVAFEGFVVDGQYSLNRLVELGTMGEGRVVDSADHTIIRDCELKRAARDLVQVNEADHVLIERCLIHHALRWGPNENKACGKRKLPRCDAHGITGGNGRLEDLIIRDTEIHTVSGDAIQFDPDRHKLGWDNVRIERCTLYNRVLLEDEPDGRNGFPVGAMPGENALDTKAAGRAPRANLYVTDTVAHGWKAGPIDLGIGLPSAWNIKENVKVWFDRVTTYDSRIAFRVRGQNQGRKAAETQLKNAVIYSTQTAIRTENNVGNPGSYIKGGGGTHEAEPPVEVFNVTIGEGVPQPFQLQGGKNTKTVIDLRNLLILGSLPRTKSGGSFVGSPHLSVRASAFVNAAAHDYHLAMGSPAIDAGVAIADVRVDRDGISRPQQSRYDVGAYEYPGASHSSQSSPPLVTPRGGSEVRQPNRRAVP